MSKHSGVVRNGIFLSPPQISRELGVRLSTIYGWIRRGELTGVNLSNGHKRPRFKVTRESLAKFLDARTVRPPEKRGRKARETRPDDYVTYYP